MPVPNTATYITTNRSSADRHLQRRVIRDGVAGPHHAIDDPGLATDLGGEPAGQDRQISPAGPIASAKRRNSLDWYRRRRQRSHRLRQAEQQHEQAQPNHDAERPEDDRRVRPIVGGKLLQTGDLAVPGVGQDDSCRDAVISIAYRVVSVAMSGKPKRMSGMLCAGLVLPVALDRGDLGRLVLQRVEAVLVTDLDLDRARR